MYGKALSAYAAALVITLFGAGATMLIVNLANSPEVALGYASEYQATIGDDLSQ